MVGTYDVFKSISNHIKMNNYEIKYRDEVNAVKGNCIFVKNIITDGSTPVTFGIVVRGKPLKGFTTGNMMKQIASWNNNVCLVKVKDHCGKEQYLEVDIKVDNVDDAGTDDMKRSVLTCDITFVIYFRKEGWK